MEKYTPYIAKVAYFTVERDDFDEIFEFVEKQTIEYSYRELCDGNGYYIEFEPQVLDNPNVPNIGNVKELEVDVIQIWADV